MRFPGTPIVAPGILTRSRELMAFQEYVYSRPILKTQRIGGKSK
jgi:hypothetical protein